MQTSAPSKAEPRSALRDDGTPLNVQLAAVIRRRIADVVVDAKGLCGLLLPGARDHLRQEGDAGRAQLFEERALGLHDGRAAFDPIDEREDELANGFEAARVAGLHTALSEERRNPVEVRIEPDTQRMTQLTDTADQGVRKVERLSQGGGAPDAPR